MKLRTKNFLFTTTIIMVVVTLAIGALYLIMPNYYRQQKQQEINAQGEIIKELIAKSDGLSDDVIEQLNIISFETTISISLIDENQQTVYPEFLMLPVGVIAPTKEITQESSSTTQHDTEGQSPSFNEIEVKSLILSLVLKDKNQATYELDLQYPIQPIDDAKDILLNIYPWILLIALVIGGISAFIYSYFSTKKINSIIKTTQTMTNLKKAPLNANMGQDEIGTLAQNINYLYTSLLTTITRLDEEVLTVSEVERSKAEFMRIASHELKTPITAINGVIEGMIYNIGDFKDHEKYLRVCKDILDQQTTLVQDILYVSKLDMLVATDEASSFSADQLILENSSIYEILAKTDNLTFTKEIASTTLFGQADDFKRIFHNLMANALKYTDPQGLITLELNKDHLIIENQCTPLAEKELEKLFEAFYRPDFARNRKDGGSGLGLFIVAQLLERNNWYYQFKPSADNRGMSFEIRF